MPGTSRDVLAAFRLQLPDAAVGVVDREFQNSDEHDVGRPGMLKLIEPEDHLATVQAVGAAKIFLAGLSEKASGCCSAWRNESRESAVKSIDKDRIDAVETFKPAAHRVEMRLRIAAVGGKLGLGPPIRQAESRAVDQSSIRIDRTARSITARSPASISRNNARSRCGQRAQQAGLANTGRSHQQDLGAAFLLKAFVSRNYLHGIRSPSLELGE